MNKAEFMQVLVQRLRGLPQAEIDKSLSYYDEIISDRMEEGMSEAEAVAALGDVDDIATNILYETPLPKLVKARVDDQYNKNNNKVLWLIIVLLSFPIWLPVLCTAFGLLIGLFATLFGLIVALFAVLFALGASALGFLFHAVYLFSVGSVGAGLCFLGSSLAGVGLLLLLSHPISLASKGFAKCTRSIVHGIKSLFVSKKAPETGKTKEVLE